MPRKSETVDSAAVAAKVAVAAPEPVQFGRFLVREVPAASDSGIGWDVFDIDLNRRVDGPFRDEDAAVARARKREIRG